MKLLVFSLSLSCIISCTALKPMKMLREDNNSTSLKTDGFYFWRDSASNWTGIIVLYRNGVFSKFGSDEKEDPMVDNWKAYLLSLKKYNLGNVPFWWGLYQIRKDTVWFEKWISTDYYYPTISFSAKIENDSTFHIFNDNENLDYHFHQFSPKPDSTNKFIK